MEFKALEGLRAEIKCMCSAIFKLKNRHADYLTKSLLFLFYFYLSSVGYAEL